MRLPEYKGPENVETNQQEESKDEQKRFPGENVQKTSEISNKCVFRIEKNAEKPSRQKLLSVTRSENRPKRPYRRRTQRISKHRAVRPSSLNSLSENRNYISLSNSNETGIGSP